MAISLGVVLGLILLFPTVLPSSSWTYAIPTPKTIPTPTVIPPSEPPPRPIDQQVIADVYIPPQERREVNLISKGYLRYIMGHNTGWRPFVNWGQMQTEDGSWTNNDAFFDMIWEMVQCESGAEYGSFVRTDKVGDLDIGYRSIGVFQINATVWPQLADKYNLFDPAENAQAAYIIFREQGLEAWSCYGR